jgi:hypothetical protein
MKKLLAMLTVGGVLALTTGCPPAPSTPPPPVKPPMGDHKTEKPEPKIEKPEPKTEKPEPKIEKPEPKIEKPEPKIEKPEPKIEKPEPKPEDKPITGKVTKVDKNTLTVDGKEVKVPADAEVLIDGKKDKLENVKADSNVTITEKDGKVTKVEVKK